MAQAVLLNGRPFPERPHFSSDLPPAARTLHVSAKAAPGGDGSRERPWNDLQAALRSLSPGDRLSVGEGELRGPVRVDGACRPGSEAAPIQVVFEKASFQASGDEPILTVERPHWRFERFSAELEGSATPAISIEGRDAIDVVIDAARITGGGGPAVRVGAGAFGVVVANSTISRAGRGVPAVGAMGIVVEPGTYRTRLVGNRILDRPSGAVRIGPPADTASSLPPPSGVLVEGNTLLNSRAPALLVTDAAEIRVFANTILSTEGAGGLEGRAIVVLGGKDVRVESNHVVDASVGVQVGWVEPEGTGQSRPANVLVLRNYFERRAALESAGVDVESGSDVRIANNVFEDVSDGLLLFGTPPRTERLVIANNLLIGVSRLAFRADDLSCAVLFDGNVFSPRTPSMSIEIGGTTRDLGRYLAGHMRKSRVKPGVRILRKDLDRVEGVETRDAGIPVEGVSFQGRAPDLGLSEH